MKESRDRHRHRDRFYIAVEGLASHDGSIQDRLENALKTLLPLKPEDSPQELRSDHVLLRSYMHEVQATGEEGNIAASMRVISSDEARKVAELIVSIHARLERMHDDLGDPDLYK